MRSGAKAYRYRLHHKEGIIKLISCVNGLIRHTSRLSQLHRVCSVLQISCLEPISLTKGSHWFAGFFDADGTIGISMKKERPQLSIRVTNKHLQDVQWYKTIFGGSIYYDTSQNGYYQWSVQSRKDISELLDYFQTHPFRSNKSKRFHLIMNYFKLVEMEAFLATSSHYKSWQSFMNQ